MSTYGSDQKKINNHYLNTRSKELRYVLFVTDKQSSGQAGYMRLNGQFGYVFAGAPLKTAAHELGHGVFKLEHPKQSYPNLLMDNSSKTGEILSHLDWQQIGDPTFKFYGFQGQEDWKEARDYFLNDSPLARGNAFNKKAGKLYDVNELNLENGNRLDSYVEPINGKQGEIISRKATDLEEIQLNTFEVYLKEMQNKYSAGIKIRSNKYPDLDGDVLEGRQILEIPKTNQGFDKIQEYIDLAKNKYNIDIRFTPE